MWSSFVIPIVLISYVAAQTTNNPSTIATPISAALSPDPALQMDTRRVFPDDLIKTEFKHRGNFFATDAIGYYSSIYRTNKKAFSFYLWPREVCSYVEVWGLDKFDSDNQTNGPMVYPKTKIVFKPMEQRLEVHEKGISENKGYYYPYNKVEFLQKNNKYYLEVVGSNDDCRATYCRPRTPDSDISINAANYVMLNTNSPFCHIRANSDNVVEFYVNGGKYLYQGDKIETNNTKIPQNSFARIKARPRSRTRSKLFPLPGIPTPPTPYKRDGAGDNSCCPRMKDLVDTMKEWPGSVDNSHATVAEYKFELRRPPGGKFTLRSFLLEIKNPEKCSYVRLCFGKDVRCTKQQNNLIIMPMNGVMIRTDDDQAVMLGAPTQLLNSFRIDIMDRWYDSSSHHLAVRYVHAGDIQTGLNEIMELTLPVQDKDLHDVILQRAPGCAARLNNDYQEQSLRKGRSRNEFYINSCECFKQEEEFKSVYSN